jgi:general secretion pathway protein H
LLELLVVLVIVAVAASLASLALPRSTERQLDDDAARLALLLDAARARAAALQAPVRIETRPSLDGDAGGMTFRFVGFARGRWQELSPPLGAQALRTPGASLRVEQGDWLGPEPIGEPFRLVIVAAEGQRVVASDGLSAFTVLQP